MLQTNQPEGCTCESDPAAATRDVTAEHTVYATEMQRTTSSLHNERETCKTQRSDSVWHKMQSLLYTKLSTGYIL